MQKQILKKRKTLYTVLLFLIINICASFVLVEAANFDSNRSESPKTVYVGWYYQSVEDSKDTISTNAYGGFVNEYLQKISEIAGLNFKYKYSTLTESLKMLEEGKIDLVPGVLYTSARASKYNYIRPPISTCNVSVFAKNGFEKENQERKLENNSLVFKGKTIGTLDTLTEYCNETLKEEKYDISSTKFKYYSNFQELKEALITGKIDYIIELTPLLDMNGIKEVFKLKQTYLYLVVNIDNEKLRNQINFGLRNINKENKYFREQLFYKYISPKRQVEFLTPKERAALDKTDKLTFYVREDKNAMNRAEFNGEIGGYYSSYLKKISKILGKDYEVLQVNKEQLAKSNTPGFFCAINLNKGKLANNKDAIYADYVTNLITNPTRYSEKIVCTRKGINKLSNNAIYASANDVIVSKYRALGHMVIFTENSVEALKLLEEKKIDAAIVDIVMAKYVDSSSKYNDIEILDFEESGAQGMMGIKGVDPDLFSAVNKAITLLPESETRMYTFDGKRGIIYKPTIWERLTNYLQIFIFLGFIILIGTILFIETLINKNNKINKLAEKADLANSAKHDFLSRISHEMRTPLNAIIGYAKIGINEKNSLEDEEYFEKIKYSSEILLGLMQDSLELENVKAKTIEEKGEIVTTEDIIKKTESIISPLAEKKNIKFISVNEFSPNFKNGIIYVKTNEKAIQQIFLNLLTNAVKYTKPGGLVSWKRKFTPLDNNNILIEHEIKDTGVGMSDDFQKHMFEEFSMEENELSKTEIGTGLGLALCKKMIDKIGGTLVCESKLGVGTTFFITSTKKLASAKEIENHKKDNSILVKCIKKAPTISKKNEEIISLASSKFRDLKILICEDVLINKKILEKILTSEGMHVEWAENGKIGVEMAMKNKYNLIIMDIRMPVMDGLTAAKIIRAKDSKIPIIALSANVYASDVEKSLEAGMNAHLGKPIDNGLLLATISRLTSICQS